LEQYTPPAVVINQQREIVFFVGRTGAYLQPPIGAPSLNIMALIHPQLRIALQTAISATLKTQSASIREHLSVTIADGVQPMTLIVQPFAEQLLLVVFQELGPPLSAAPPLEANLVHANDEAFALQLTQELQTTRDALEETIDELQDANTELTLANEELLSLNEELQSTNEEFQTSKEEIQSINEELQTVNTELHRKVEELDRVNADLANLFASMQLPVVFLHADGRIARFTPTATCVFRLIENDVGRPISDIAPRFQGSDLNEAIALVLRTLSPYEVMVRRPETQTWWMMRIRPYWTLANIIDGVVLMFVDISDLKHAQLEQERLLAAVVQARSDAERIIETVRGPLLILDATLRVQSANRAFYQMFQTTAEETEQVQIYALGDQHWNIPQLRALLGDQINSESDFKDIQLKQAFPKIGERTILLNARQLQHMPNSHPLLLLAIEDISERTEMAAVLQQAHDELEQRVQERTSELAQMNAALQSEMNEHQQAEQARQLLLHQLVTAQEEERRRIARELHDQMGQDLTVLMLGLKAIRDAAPASSTMHQQIEPLQALATQIGREVRGLALQLRPPALDDLGLVATLANMIEQWSAQVLITVDFHTSGLEQERLPWPVETALYRLVQEALTNILKHAQATSVNLIIDRRFNAVHMILEDDGIGFDIALVRQQAHVNHRLGLIGMQERVAQLGGTLTIETAVSGGTSIFVRLPLATYEPV
jgi:two-component system CheB/CheR fusion protein